MRKLWTAVLTFEINSTKTKQKCETNVILKWAAYIGWGQGLFGICYILIFCLNPSRMFLKTLVFWTIRVIHGRKALSLSSQHII